MTLVGLPVKDKMGVLGDYFCGNNLSKTYNRLSLKFTERVLVCRSLFWTLDSNLKSRPRQW